MPFKFAVAPLESDKAVFKGPVDSAKLNLQLTNETEAKAAWKVRVTCNDTFKIVPAVGLVEAGETASCLIESKAASVPSGTHHLFVNHIPAEGDKDAQSLWTANKGKGEEKRILIEFKPDAPADDGGAAAPADAPAADAPAEEAPAE